MEKKFLVMIIVFSLLAWSANSMAKEGKGADLIIQKADGTSVKGELIAVKQGSILLLDRHLGVDCAVDIHDIRIINITGKSNTLKGGLLGLSVGIVGGYLVGYPQGTENGFVIISKPQAGAIGAAIGGVLCALVGVVIGKATSGDEAILVEGKSDAAIKKIMEELRKKARIKNVQ